MQKLFIFEFYEICTFRRQWKQIVFMKEIFRQIDAHRDGSLGQQKVHGMPKSSQDLLSTLSRSLSALRGQHWYYWNGFSASALKKRFGAMLSCVLYLSFFSVKNIK